MKHQAEVSAQPSKEDKADKDPEQYEVEDAANTLMRAHEIRNNKKLMPHVHKHLSKKKKAITSVQGLRDKYKELVDEED